jgi:hypothetical protein
LLIVLRKLDVEDFFEEQKRLKEEAKLKEQQYQDTIKEHLKKKTPSQTNGFRRVV